MKKAQTAKKDGKKDRADKYLYYVEGIHKFTKPIKFRRNRERKEGEDTENTGFPLIIPL